MKILLSLTAIFALRRDFDKNRAAASNISMNERSNCEQNHQIID